MVEAQGVSQLEAPDIRPDSRPRVLHLLASLARGGIETWLVHMLRHEKEFSVRHELLLTKADVGPYEAEVRELGIRIHRLPLSDGKLSWFGRFARLLRDEGPFAAVHSHAAPHFAAPALATAKRGGVPIRIAHSHSARSRSEGEDYPLRLRIARQLAIPWFRIAATRRIGITELAIEEIAGPRRPTRRSDAHLRRPARASRSHRRERQDAGTGAREAERLALL